MRALRIFLFVFPLLLIGGAWGFGTIATRPHASPPPVAPEARTVALRTADHVRIEASYWPGRHAASPGVLLLHGFGAARGAMLPQARWLHGLGLAVLVPDLRGHGTSQLAPRGIGAIETRDAKAAFDWLKARQQGARIGVIGISQGGAAALVGRDGPLPADALVLQAVYPDLRRAIRHRIAWFAGPAIAWLGEPLLSYQSLPRWGLWPSDIAPIVSVRRFDAPVMVLGGGADPWTPPAETRAICHAAPHCIDLWLVPGQDHVAMSVLDGPDYHARVGAFLSRALEARR